MAVVAAAEAAVAAAAKVSVCDNGCVSVIRRLCAGGIVID